MTDTVQIALITASFNVLALVVARVMSKFEHQDTANKIEAVHQVVNSSAEAAKLEAKRAQEEILRLTRDKAILQESLRAKETAEAVKVAINTLPPGAILPPAPPHSS